MQSDDRSDPREAYERRKFEEAIRAAGEPRQVKDGRSWITISPQHTKEDEEAVRQILVPLVHDHGISNPTLEALIPYLLREAHRYRTEGWEFDDLVAVDLIAWRAAEFLVPDHERKCATADREEARIEAELAQEEVERLRAELAKAKGQEPARQTPKETAQN